jgi:maltose O-acetyltransferase
MSTESLTSPPPPRPSGLAYRDYLRAFRSPGLVIRQLVSRWKLRSCTFAPITVRCWGRVRVTNQGEIFLGDRVRIEGRTVPVELVAWRGARLEIGAGTYLNYGASVSAHRSVSIGSECLIGNYTVIMDSDYHGLRDRDQPDEPEPVIIEDNVWVGLRAIVLKGVRIGRGSVVAAGSVVTKDVPPGVLVAGMPARIIRKI